MDMYVLSVFYYGCYYGYILLCMFQYKMQSSNSLIDLGSLVLSLTFLKSKMSFLLFVILLVSLHCTLQNGQELILLHSLENTFDR